MNVFRLAGDMCHVLAIIILMSKILRSKSCAGLSGRSQILFLVTYVCRYLDLFTNFVSAYNTTMKIFFVVSTAATVFLIYVKFRASYSRVHDTFRIELLLLAASGLSLIFNYEFTVLEVLWAFSVYLEAVAILPQLFMISKRGEAETITCLYLVALGSYRALYILNWIYRYHYEGFYDTIAIVCGVVQTILYCDFFYLYATKDGFVKSADAQEDEKLLAEDEFSLAVDEKKGPVSASGVAF